MKRAEHHAPTGHVSSAPCWVAWWPWRSHSLSSEPQTSSHGSLRSLSCQHEETLTGGKWWKFCPGACSPGIAGGYRICCHSSKPWYTG